MHLKMSSAIWQPFCLGLNVLSITNDKEQFRVAERWKNCVCISLVYMKISYLIYVNDWDVPPGMYPSVNSWSMIVDVIALLIGELCAFVAVIRSDIVRILCQQKSHQFSSSVSYRAVQRPMGHFTRGILWLQIDNRIVVALQKSYQSRYF